MCVCVCVCVINAAHCLQTPSSHRAADDQLAGVVHLDLKPENVLVQFFAAQPGTA